MAEKPLEYREIITKAICGKGKKFCQNVHAIQSPEKISNILGAWLINHTFTSERVGESVEIRGSYHVNIWYSTQGNTQTDVIKESVHYVEQIPLSYYDKNIRDQTGEVSASVTQTPNCVEATLSAEHDTILVRVEKEFVVELVGETKVCVAVYPTEYSEFDDKELISGISDIEQGETTEISHFDDLDPELVIDDLDD